MNNCPIIYCIRDKHSGLYVTLPLENEYMFSAKDDALKFLNKRDAEFVVHDIQNSNMKSDLEVVSFYD